MISLDEDASLGWACGVRRDEEGVQVDRTSVGRTPGS